MKVRCYAGLQPATISGFAKFRKAIEADDFASAQISKISHNLYRARLGRSARLLFSFYAHDGRTDCLVLEHLPNHDYEKSRFLSRGAGISAARVGSVENSTSGQSARATDGLAAGGRAAGGQATENVETLDTIQPEPLAYLNPASENFHILDKVLSFDDEQQAIFDLPAPLVIVGSAGSGKTALTLEKMKQAVGDVLYVSLSPFLVESARALYHSHGYDNEDQVLDFLSFTEFLETIEVPAGREVNFADFNAWFQRHKAGSGIRDAHTLFEEFRGVITGPVGDGSWLSREAYLTLGVRQSIFADSERDAVYTLFERYLRFLDDARLFDPNIVCHRYRDRTQPRYDFVVVDEVQDFTNIQLYLVLSGLRNAGDFLLCGDANQIVHPNFFSWSSLKSLFFENCELTGHSETLHVLSSNYRNSPLVTNIANRILKLKHARFGSVDRESNHLVSSRGLTSGSLQLLQDNDAVRNELDQKTGRSTRFAVLVMHADDKAEASRLFSTPLVFSIQEAKGLEYDSIILFNFISGEQKVFRDIAAGVQAADLESEELAYARAKSKQDKSLEIYKFYINALYVAITRAVKNLYIIEQQLDHPAIRLLDLERFSGELSLDAQGSSVEEWQREARKLELQGKREQADAIHERILERKPVPWPVFDRHRFEALCTEAFETSHKKKLLQAFESAVLHQHQPTLNRLTSLQFKPVKQPQEKALKQLHRQHYMTYDLGKPAAVLKDTERYGIDHRTVFNLTPLMVAAQAGNAELVQALLERGADASLVANNGLTAYQMVLELATTHDSYARQKSANVHALLKPETLSIQVDGRLIKLGGRLMEMFLLNLMFAQFYRHLNMLGAFGDAFSAKFIAAWVEDLPDAVLPEKRKRQAYISSVLSKNEMTKDGPYNRKLFLRVSRGQYIINPVLQLRLGDQWVRVHDLLILDDLAPNDVVNGNAYPIRSEQQRQIREQVRLDRLERLETGLQRFKQMVASVMQLHQQHTATEAGEVEMRVDDVENVDDLKAESGNSAAALRGEPARP